MVWKDLTEERRNAITKEINACIKFATKVEYFGNGQNIIVANDIVYSYNTPVAVYIEGHLWVPKWHSVTTTRHINKVAAKWRCPVVKMWK